jgi:hypothetical protein
LTKAKQKMCRGISANIGANKKTTGPSLIRFANPQRYGRKNKIKWIVERRKEKAD